MSSVQWIDWQVYMELAPFVEEREDLRVARIVTTIVNIVRDEKKHPVPYDTIDFVQRFGDTPEYLGPAPTKHQSSEIFGEIMRGLAETYRKGVK